MRKNTVNSIIFLFMLFVLFAKPASAITAPSFPSCLNPQGTVIASYATGNHGIVGYATVYSGADKVYSLSDGALLQCFCGTDGNGIQTNWFKASGLTEDEKKSLEAQHWTYVPSGTPWGLTPDPYFAKNNFYNCQANVGGGSSSTGSGSSSSSSTGSSSNDLGGKVLGLAFTGSNEYIFKLWLYGLVALIFGVWIKRYNARKKSSQ